MHHHSGSYQTPTSPGGSTPGASPERSGIPWSLLRIPVFLKILLANVVIAAVAGGMALVLTPTVTELSLRGGLGVTVLLFAIGVLFLGTALNAVVVRLALSPLMALARTADGVRSGDLSARAPLSALADRETRSLVILFNRMLDTLQADQQRQRHLAGQVLDAEERERERIAHELFAGPAQTLAGAMVRLRLAARGPEKRSGCKCPDCPAPTEEVRDQIALALDEIRVLARRLRPPELGELGLRAALDAHSRTLIEGRNVCVRIHGSLDDLDRDTSTVLFRILQEAITNAVLHSGGSEVDVVLTTERDRVAATVCDDGKGFDPLRQFEAPGTGITGMQERASYLGGSVEVAAGDVGGVRVRVELPLEVPWSGAARVPGAQDLSPGADEMPSRSARNDQEDHAGHRKRTVAARRANLPVAGS